MSAMVKLTQENDESCVYVVDYGMAPPSPRPADCGMPVDGVALRYTAPTRSGRSRRHRGACFGADDDELPRAGRSRRHRGACLGDEVRHGVPDDVLPRQAVECPVLSRPAAAGFMVIPTNMVGQTCERVSDCCGSHVKRVVTRRKDTVTFNEEVGKDKTSNDVWRAERRCQG